MRSTIVFEPEFRNADVLRGLDGFSHLWLLWIFSENVRDTWSPTVRPPRLGGNKRLGVFATRSSFRPNPIAMSCVKIEEIHLDGNNGPEIVVSGADLMSETPIVDIKPYLPYADCIEGAAGGFAGSIPEGALQVRETLIEILKQDPRPHYQNDPSRIYGFSFGGSEVHFQVDGDILTVTSID